MKTKKSFLQKTIIAMLVALLLTNFIIPQSVFAVSIYWDDYGNTWEIDYSDTSDLDSKNWKYEDYRITDDMINQAINDYPYSTTSPEVKRENANAFNSALNSWADGEHTLSDALDKAWRGAMNQSSDAADEGPGQDADRDGHTGATVGDPDDEGTDIGGVLLNPFLDLLCSLGDLVINFLQWSMTDVSTSPQRFSINTFLVSSSKASGKVDTSGGEQDGEPINVELNKLERGWLAKRGEYYYPVTTYSPEEIFAGVVPGLDINFIKPNFSNNEKSSAWKLQEIIAGWYVSLRNLAIVGLLSVLVYIGIRIIISSTAQDKAKYKQYLIDWLIALCLLFFMHYIMSFVLTMTESVCSAISGYSHTDATEGTNYSKYNTVTVNVNGGSPSSFKTNLLGAARFQTQYKNLGQRVAYVVMYLALVVYTCIFTLFYLRRVLMMAFLTMIAPLVALTYPIDKMNDGQAQAFNSWIKEYVYNALIQPFHLILYMIFVKSAMTLATTNIIYMIAALGFILPAEKILRSFFGFNKAGAGTLGSLVGGAAIGSYLSKSAKNLLGGNESSGKGSSGGKGQSAQADKPVRYENKHDLADINPDSDIGSRVALAGASSGNNSENTAQSEQDMRQQKMDELNEQMRQYEEENGIDGLGQNGDSKYNQMLAEYQQLAQAQGSKQQEAQEGLQIPERMKDNAPLTTRQKLGNLARYNGSRLGRGGLRAIKGIAKTGTRIAFRGAVGGLAAAVAMASGGGLAGGLAAAAVGSTVGGKMANGTINATGSIANGSIGRFIDNQIDVANGNTNRQKARAVSDFKNNQNNFDYLRDKMTAEAGGVIPTAAQVRNRMDSFDAYLSEGMTDIGEIMKAQKMEDYIEGDSVTKARQAAIIASIAKERNITADILEDEKKRNAKYNNMEYEFRQKGYGEAQAKAMADNTFAKLDVMYGVGNSNNLNKKKSSKDRMAEAKARHAANDAKRAQFNSRNASRPMNNMAAGNQQQGGQQKPISTREGQFQHRGPGSAGPGNIT